MPKMPTRHRPTRQRLPIRRHVPRGYRTKRSSDYNARWKRISKHYLRRHPLCCDPFGYHDEDGIIVVANEVDHIVPLRAGGTHASKNLQALCRSCHSKKTVRFDGGFGNAQQSFDNDR